MDRADDRGRRPGRVLPCPQRDRQGRVPAARRSRLAPDGRCTCSSRATEVWFKGVGRALRGGSPMREPRHLTLVTADRESSPTTAADEIVGPVPREEMAELYSRRTCPEDVERGGHVRATARGLPPRCDMRRDTGDGPRRVRRPRLERARDRLGRPAWPGARSTCWRATAGFFTSCARTLETARAWPSGEQSSDFMASALLATRRRLPPDPAAGTERLLGDVRAALDGYRVHLQEREELEYAASVISWARAHRLTRLVRRAGQRRSGPDPDHAVHARAACRAPPRSPVADVSVRPSCWSGLNLN